MDDDFILTQEATQQIQVDDFRQPQIDADDDIAQDGICILEPVTRAATTVVRNTLFRRPDLVACQDGIRAENLDAALAATVNVKGIVLRLSSLTKSPSKYFTFGRVSACDVVFEEASFYVSKLHFRIFLSSNGILMFEEKSLNGTMVDGLFLKRSEGKQGEPSTRMLSDQSRIAVMIPKGRIEFIVRMPERSDNQPEFLRNFNYYVDSLTPVLGTDPNFGDSPNLCETISKLPALMPGQLKTDMVWNGGEHYTSLCKIASGAFGTVFKVARKTNGEVLAIKEIIRSRFMRQDKWDRVKREITIMQELDHPNIVRLLAYHDLVAHLYMVMDYIPNGTLLEWIMIAPLNEPEGRAVSQQIISSLDYLHSRRITHRDIKPDNILVVSKNPIYVKLSDFGLSKALKTDASALMTFCGTLYYCAPEVHPESEGRLSALRLKRKSVGQAPRSYGSLVDVWSFGVVMWYALCGRQPFPLDSLKQVSNRAVYEMISTTRPDTSALLNRGISHVAVSLLIRMMQVDPMMRPSPNECLNDPWLFSGQQYISPRAVGKFKVLNSLDKIEEELDAADSPFLAADQDDDMDISMDYLGNVEIQEFPLRSVEQGPADPNFSLNEIQRFNKMVSMLDGRPADRFSSAGPAAGKMDMSSSAGDENEHPAKRLRSMWFPDGELADDSGIFNSFHRFPTAPGARHQAMSENTTPGPQDTPTEVPLSSSNLLGQDNIANQGNAGNPNDEVINENNWMQNFSRSLQYIANADSSELAHISESGRNLLNFIVAQSQEVKNGQENDVEVEGSTTPKSLDDGCTPPADAKPKNTIFDSQILLRISQAIGPKLSHFAPPNNIGVLGSTTSSIHNITIPIQGPFTSWGRHPSCTVQYPYPKDTRVSKVSLAVWFHAPGIDGLASSKKDISDPHDKIVVPENWKSLPGLHTLINTYSRFGIYVNNVHLPPHDANGNVLFGRLYTGDRITVFCKADGQLIFECKFSLGSAAQPRPEAEKPFLVQTSANRLPEMIYVPPKKQATPVGVA